MRLIALLLVLGVVWVQGDVEGCSGVPNMYPVYDKDPVLIKTTTNGKLFLAGGDNVDPQIYLAHVYGTPYEMGYAFGVLLGPQLKQFISEVLTYVQELGDGFVPHWLIPKHIQDQIIKDTAIEALDATFLLTEPFTPPYFIEEMRGMADGSGMSYEDIRRVNMIPELIQAACSMFGAWGTSIQNTDGTLVQLRALDWNTDGPFQKFPSVTVYHPSTGGHDFMTVGWVGFIGSLTGYSSAPMGICEKVWYAYDGTKAREGYPWHFLLRDILQFDIDIDEALTRIANAERTCSIFVGLGDGESNTFKAVEYSHDYIKIFNDKNYPAYPPAHPLMDGVVYIDKHVQPSNSPCLGNLLQDFYGNIDAHVTMQNITAQSQTGETHAAVYDFAKDIVYVSNAGVYDPTTKYAQNAYERQYTAFHMSALFAEPAP